MRNACWITDQILPHLDPEIGDAIGLPMPVHRRVEELSGIGKLVPYDHAGRCQRRDAGPGSTIIFIVEDPDFPRPGLIRLRLQLRRETVERNQKPGPVFGNHARNLRMIGPPEPIYPRQALFVRNCIARQDVPVACSRDDVRRILLAIEIDHQSRDGPQQDRNTDPTVQSISQFGNADVERDMGIQQIFGDTQINIWRHMVGGMIANQKHPR